MISKIFSIILLFLFAGHYLSAQDCIFSLQITDSISGEPLDYASISYQEPGKSTWRMLFTDTQGRLEVELNEGEEINLNIAFLGYHRIEVPLQCNADKDNREISIKMVKSGFEIDEIHITDQFPDMVQRKDTVIYNVSEFLTGNEDKLRDLLNKLPGLHVDRNNVVTYNGEVVRAILVEYDRFFTGDPSMAVKFIPADAVDKVEVLEAHNDFNILQGLGISDELALNIHLKEDKKQFFFGEAKAGTDAKRHHIGHNNLFYYSPNFNANNIIDVNSTDLPILTRRDIMRMVGMDMNTFDPKGDRNFMRDINEMQSMLGSTNHYRQRAVSGIQQIKYKFENRASVDVIGLGRHTKNRRSANQSIVFPETLNVLQRTDMMSFDEHQNYFVQCDLRTNPAGDAILNYRFQYRSSPSIIRNTNDLKIGETSTRNFEFLETKRYSFNHELRWIQKWQEKIRTIAIYRLTTGVDDRMDTYNLRNVLVPDIFGLDGESLQIRNNEEIKRTEHYGLLRAIYTISPLSNIDVFSRVNVYSPDLNSETLAGERGIFSHPLLSPVDTFFNAFTFSEWDVVTGMRYQLKKGNFEMHSGLEHQFISLNRNDKEDKIQKGRISPNIDVSYNFLGFAKVALRYQFNYSSPGLLRYKNALGFDEYNRFSINNDFFAPIEQHRTSLSFSRTLSRNAATVILSVINNQTRNPLISSFQFSDQAFTTRFFQSENNMNNWTLMSSINRFWINRRFVLTASASVNEFYNLVGDEERAFQQKMIMARLYFTRTWDNFELETNLNSSLRNVPFVDGEEQLVWTSQFTVNADWYIGEQWSIEAESGLSYLSSSPLDQLTIPLHLGVGYKILNNRLHFRLDGRNLLNSEFNASSNISPQMTTLTNHRIFPRYVMFSMTYVY